MAFQTVRLDRSTAKVFKMAVLELQIEPLDFSWLHLAHQVAESVLGPAQRSAGVEFDRLLQKVGDGKWGKGINHVHLGSFLPEE